MLLKLKLRQQGKFIAGILLFFQAVFVLVLMLSLTQLDYVVSKEQHSREMISISGDISKELLTMWIKAASVLLGPAPGSLVDISSLSSDLPGSDKVIKKLSSLSEPNTPEQKLTLSLEKLLHRTRAFAQERLQIDGGSGARWLDEDTILFVRLCTRIAERLNALVNFETRSLQQETAERLKFRSWVQFVLLGGVGLSTVLSMVLVVKFNRNTASRIDTLIENTRRFAAGQPLPPQLAGDDEFSELDQSFRTMSATVDRTMLAIQEGERRVRAILDNMLVGVLITDEKGNILEANPGATKLFRLSDEELQGINIGRYLTGVNDAELLKVVQGNPSKLYQAELQNISIPVEVEYVCSVLHTARGVNVIFNLVDISERRAAERMKREFVAMVSHELRSPLTAIHGLLSLVSEGSYGASDKLQNRAKLAESSASRLIRLINDWLDLEKIESGRITLNLEWCGLLHVLEDAASAIDELLGGRGISLNFDVCDAEMFVDRDRFIQVIVNVLSNAAKFSPEGSAISIGSVMDEDSFRLLISDCGPGVPAENRELIFDPYFRVPGTERSVSGTGLGLPICRKIMSAHGGEIRLSEVVTQGACFELLLPMASIRTKEV